MKARCGWCHNGFTKVEDVWWCKTLACAQKQADYAIRIGDKPFYVPLPKQIDFELAPVRYLLGGGAAGVSKSHGGRYGLYRRALAIPGFEALILRLTWDELKKHHLRLMGAEADRLRAVGIPAEYAETAREFRIRFPTGETSIIEGGHMEDPKDVNKYLSRERDAIVCDEGSTFDPQNLLELSTRARSAKPAVEAFARRLWNRPTGQIPGGGAVFWVLSNPGGPSAPMLRDFFIDQTPDVDEYPQLNECDSDGRPLYDPSEWGFVPGLLEDNPYISPTYERDLAVLKPHRYQQLRFGSWDVVAGQFFTEFDARIHVKDLGTPTGNIRWFRSYDYGYVHKGVCLWWAVLPDGRLYIRQEYVHRFQPINEIAKQMRQQTIQLRIPRISYTVGDKFSLGMRQKDDAGETRRDIFEQCGVPMDSTSHDREQGWTRCRELLSMAPDGQPWMVIHPSCVVADTRVLSRTPTTGTSVRWFDGEVVVIRTATGRHLTATPNHPILTARRWVMAGALNVGDDVICDSGCEWRPNANGNDEDMPPSIKQVVETLRKSGKMATAPVPLSAEDFHGDGIGSEVAVIGSNRLLRDGFKTSFAQQDSQIPLEFRTIASKFSRGGNPAAVLDGVPTPQNGLVGGGNLTVAFARRHAGPLQALHVAPASARNASLVQAVLDNSSADAKLARQLLNGESGPIFLDQIVYVEKQAFHGFVFNLETDGGWFIANGILTHNCRQLIRELSAAVSDDHHPEDISEHCPQDALAAWRYGAMSRPSPNAPRRSSLSRKAAGYDLRELQSTLKDRRRRVFA